MVIHEEWSLGLLVCRVEVAVACVASALAYLCLAQISALLVHGRCLLGNSNLYVCIYIYIYI